MSALLATEQLHAFYGAIHVLHGIDLTIGRGETVALMGRNGMGKTTLLRSLMGLVPQRHGRVMLGARDMSAAMPEDMARGGVAFVPEGRGIFSTLTVVENLVMAARPAADARCDWTLERIFELFPRLAERRHHWGNQLSGGEQQMLTIGRALMTNPDLILIDEATEGLAPMIAQTIWQTLGTIRDQGIAAIVVDKDFRALSALSDRVLLMTKGELVFAGTPAALKAQGELLEKHLGV
jgi:branched-chain amino acid transport system ATP-binding protein